MRLSASFAVLGLGLTVALSTHAQDPEQPPELVASTEAKTPEEENALFRLPPGFEAQLVAAEPDILKPMNLAFDAKGRLWVTSSREYPFPAEDPDQARDRVTILSDFGPDGRARSIKQFAEGLNIPIGLLPLTSDEVLVHSIPNIYRLKDTNGDGQADAREVVLGTYAFNDTHGMTNSFTWSFDGWIYACHGFANTSTITDGEGNQVTMNSGNVYRFRPDGSRVEQVTWGQVNPFGLALDPLGNLYSSDCHTRPLYQLLPGAYYPSFGKPHDGLGFGPEMMTHDHGSTGIAGVQVYEADHFPEAYRGTLFVGNPVTSRINHDQVEWNGSSPLAIEQPDFLISDDPWFRPVDIQLGPDGALYVADFYNRIIGHYEVPLTHPGRDRERGRIWRIVYLGEDGQAPLPQAPREDWTAADVDELIDDLAHPNLTVRMLATHELVGRGQDSVPAVTTLLANTPTTEQRVHGLWVLERLGVLDEEHHTSATEDETPSVRVHALRILADRSELSTAERALVHAGLNDPDAFVQRASAHTLSRHPGAENLRPLLDLRQSIPSEDTHLVHTVRMALRDQLLDPLSWANLPEPLSDRDRADLADVSTGVPSAEAASFLLGYLRSHDLAVDDLLRFVQHVARHGDNAKAEELLAFAQDHQADDLGRQVALLRSFHRGRQERGSALSPDARSWAIALSRTLLDGNQTSRIRTAIDLVETLRLTELADDLEAMLADRSQTHDRRVPALHALVVLNTEAAIPKAAELLNAADESMSLRESAAGALGNLNRPEARVPLLEAIAVVPAPIQRTIALGLTGNRAGSEALLQAIAEGKASARLLQDSAVQNRLKSAGLENVDARVSDLLDGLPPADAALADLISQRRIGFVEASNQLDANLGAKVFEQHCMNCHQLGNQGETIGPQLDGVGHRGADRLIEDILDPSRNVDQAFRTTTLALSDGRVLSGLLLREDGDVLVLADAEGKELRVSRGEVEEHVVTPISPMPANLVEQMSAEEFNQLIAFLLSRKATD